MAASDDQTNLAIGQSDRPIFAAFFDTLQLENCGVKLGNLFRFARALRDVIQPARLLPAIGEVAFTHIGLPLLR